MADPVPPVFFDTNVVLYLLSADEQKADTTEALLAKGGMVLYLENDLTEIPA